MRFVIIGTGVTGTAALAELTRRVTSGELSSAQLAQLGVTTVERGERNGPGYAYDPDAHLPVHILNRVPTRMAIRTVTADGDTHTGDFELVSWHSHDFLNWMTRRRLWLIANHPRLIGAAHPELDDLARWQPSATTYYGRALFGLYLQDSFADAVATLRAAGVHVVTLTGTEAVDGRMVDGRFQVTVRQPSTGQRLTVTGDRVLLSTGRWLNTLSGEQANPAYFPQPFPAAPVVRRLRRAGGPKRVIVRGMGLSGVDSVFSLLTGRFHRDDSGVLRYSAPPDHVQLVSVSRKGHYSIVTDRRVALHPELRVVTEDRLRAVREANSGFLTLGALRELVEAELRLHLGHDVDLVRYALSEGLSAFDKLRADMAKARSGNIVNGIFQRTLGFQLFSQLSSTDKVFFERHVLRYFLQNIAGMPYPSAEKLLALNEAGVLDAVGVGDESSVEFGTGRPRLCWRDDSGNETVLEADYLLNAAGDVMDVSQCRDPFLRSLLDNGTVTTGDFGAGKGGYTGGMRVHGDYAVVGVGADGAHEVSDVVYAVGMHVDGWTERDFASASVGAVIPVVAAWVDHASRCIAPAPAHLHAGRADALSGHGTDGTSQRSAT